MNNDYGRSNSPLQNIKPHHTNTISLDPVRLARQECHHILTSLDLKLFCEDTSPILKGINNETPQRVSQY